MAKLTKIQIPHRDGIASELGMGFTELMNAVSDCSTLQEISSQDLKEAIELFRGNVGPARDYLAEAEAAYNDAVAEACEWKLGLDTECTEAELGDMMEPLIKEPNRLESDIEAAKELLKQLSETVPKSRQGSNGN